MEFKGIMSKLPVMDVLQTKKECERRGITFEIENYPNMKCKIAYAEGYNVAKSEGRCPVIKEKRSSVILNDDEGCTYFLALTDSQIDLLEFICEELGYELTYSVFENGPDFKAI